MLDFAIDTPKAQLWAEMGLGKTVVAASAVADLMDQIKVSRVLIVAPLRVVETVWPNEFAKWSHLNHLPWRQIRGSAQRRAKMAEEPYYGIELINYENLKSLFLPYAARHKQDGAAQWSHPFPWDMVIFDESSKLKDPGTQRFRTVRVVCRRMERVLHLTGSPAPNGLLNLWAPTFVLDQGERLGPTYTAYVDRWFKADDFRGWKLSPLPGAEDHVHEKLQDVTMSLRAQDYLDLPPVMTTDVKVDLPNRVRDTYREMEEEMFLQLASGTVEVANGGVLTQKCRQLAQGSLYVNQKNDNWEDLHDAKLKALDDIIEEAEGAPLLVAYAFKFDLHRLKKRYGQRAVSFTGSSDTRGIINRFRAGEIPLLLIHPMSAGHGLDGLQDGTDSLVWYGMDWSPDRYEQTLARLAGGLRRKRPTFIYRIVANSTVDFDMINAVENGITIQDALKQRMASRRRAAA